MRAVNELIQGAVLLAAAIIGTTVAVGFMVLASQGILNQPQPVGLQVQRPPESDRIVFEMCIVFFSVAYAVGVTGYRWAGAWEKERSVAGISEQHLPLLHLVGSIWMLAFHGPKVFSGTAQLVDWISLAIGALLLGAAVLAMRRVYRTYHPFGLGRRMHDRTGEIGTSDGPTNNW